MQFSRGLVAVLHALAQDLALLFGGLGQPVGQALLNQRQVVRLQGLHGLLLMGGEQ